MSNTQARLGAGFLLFGTVVAGSALLRKRKRQRSYPPAKTETPSVKTPSRSEFGTLLLGADKGWDVCVSTEEGAGEKCELHVINNLGVNCVLSWVSNDGTISNGHRLINGGSIKDGSVSNEHVEFAYAFHSFVVMRECAAGYPSHLKELQAQMLLCSYRPEIGGQRHVLRITATSPPGSDPVSVLVTAKPLIDRTELIDTSSKIYEMRTINGFEICYEPGVFEKNPLLEGRLEEDCAMAARLLPELACSLLQQSTSIWLNDSLVYGPKAEPISGRGCCYHPVGGQSWLMNNGMKTEKSGCIEIYSASSYLCDNDLWGVGGVLVHELSHAYHDKYTEGGYANVTVDAAYREAMASGRYNCVSVHGKQGLNGPTKAYACANRMEFWAELSVAYMWSDDESCEYNKWFPFNRAQLRQHDPLTHSVIEELWNAPFLK